MKKIILVIRDGWGYSKHKKGNAIKNAKTPNNDIYEKKYPWTILRCTGHDVGLPETIQGGSEVGHLTMGLGRIIWHPFEIINKSIKNKTFFKNKILMKAIKNCKKYNSDLHLIGLFSDEGIHGTSEHLYTLLKLAKKNKIKNVYVHAMLDGRDVPERSALKFLKEFNRRSKKIGVGKIVSMVGRYYAMDRDNNYNRTKKAYNLFVNGKGINASYSVTGLQNYYSKNKDTDYYVKPIVITDNKNKPIAIMKDNDSVINWNFRSDRQRQITYALTKRIFNKFERKNYPKLHYTCMSVYDKKLNLDATFSQSKVKNNLGNILSKNNLKQLRIAESEKYAHVTYFFNGQVEKINKGETRIMIPSPKVPSYASKPEMSAYELTKILVKEIKKNKYDFILINFANGDLVGHSANMRAGIKACEAVDKCLGDVVNTGLENDYVILLTADHGNIEKMFYPNGKPCPSHGTNPVQFFVISNEEKLMKAKLKKNKGLCSVSPTILDLMKIRKPKEMTCDSLIRY